MNNKKENHFKASYIDDLKLINGIHFTAREIDITACLLNARGTSRIASLLEISPRTVANHIRNLMVKLECNSREGIIDFIEKDNKQALLRTHYSHLSLEKAFQDALKAVRKLVYKTPSYSIIPGKGKKGFCEQAEKIKTHLERAGLTLHLEIRKKHTSIVDLIEEAKKEKYGIYIISTDLDEIQNIAFSKNISSNNQMSPNALFLFMEKLGLGEIPHALDGIKCIDFTRFENYYFSVFEVLKALFPHINIENTIEDFKKRYERTYESVEAKNLHKNVNTQKKLSFSVTKNLLKEKKWYFLSILLALISSLSIGFFTLQEIRRTSQTTKKFRTSIHSDLLLPNESVFLDRPDLMTQIDNAFKDPGNGIRTVALVGMGGAGKTTVARHYAYQQDADVAWEINAETPASLMASFENLAQALSKTEVDKKQVKELLEIKDTRERETKIALFVKERLKRSSNWLLIYDNVKDFVEIQPSFPKDATVWGNGKVILTTRNHNIQNNKRVNGIVLLGELSLAQKLRLYMQIINQGIRHSLHVTQDKSLMVFLKRLPPFPLDISVAAYYLKTTNLSYENYLERLDQQDKTFTILQENLLEEAGEYTKTRYGIITLAVNQLINTHKDFEDLLLLISLLDSQNIPRDLLDSYKEKTIVDNFIFHLKKNSLITTTVIPSIGPSLSIHRSTQAIFLNYLLNLKNGKNTLNHIISNLENYAAISIRNSNPSIIKNCSYHCEVFLNQKGLSSHLLNNKIKSELGRMYLFLGYYIRAQELLEESYAALKEYPTEDPIRLSRTLTYIGIMHKVIGEPQKAEQFLKQALVVYEKNNVTSGYDLAMNLTFLGELYRELGKYGPAKAILERSLAIYNKPSNSKDELIPRALVQLGAVYRDLGDYKKAEQLGEKAYSIFRKEVPGTGIAMTLNFLGEVNGKLGNYIKARDFLIQSQFFYNEFFSKKHP